MIEQNKSARLFRVIVVFALAAVIVLLAMIYSKPGMTTTREPAEVEVQQI